MICNYCQIEFIPRHWNQKICGLACKYLAVQRAKAAYKRTEKGKASNEKWIQSERRKENEKHYRQTPRARQRAVRNMMAYLKHNPHAREAKRNADRSYQKSSHGREINKAAQARYRATENGSLVRRIAKARRRKAEGSFSVLQWKEKLIEYRNQCTRCGATEGLEIDHIVPISRGGKNTIDNVQPLCRSCNASKGSRLMAINFERLSQMGLEPKLLQD